MAYQIILKDSVLEDLRQICLGVYDAGQKLTVEELNAWAESIKPIARMAFEGKGEQHPGDWCRFCPVRATCRTRAEANLELAVSD